LFPAVLLAPFLLAVFERRGVRSMVSRFRWLYGIAIGLGVAAFAVQVGTGRSPQELLGAYSPVDEAGYELGEVLRYLWWHVAELSLYVLVIPSPRSFCRSRSLSGLRLKAFAALVR
jgi:hypothetical protein